MNLLYLYSKRYTILFNISFNYYIIYISKVIVHARYSVSGQITWKIFPFETLGYQVPGYSVTWPVVDPPYWTNYRASLSSCTGYDSLPAHRSPTRRPYLYARTHRMPLHINSVLARGYDSMLYELVRGRRP